MTDESKDPVLDAEFRALRRSMAEGGRIPDFEPMLEAARAEARQAPPEPGRRRLLRWMPLAAAAAVAGLLVLARPGSDADAEFERLVADYSELAVGGAWRSPTSSLLQTPGVDLGDRTFLRWRAPAVRLARPRRTNPVRTPMSRSGTKAPRFLLLAGLWASLALFPAAAPLAAQDAGAAEALQDDPLFETLFPPELIMQHRRAIGLDDEQRDAISRLISDLQGRVLALQWELLDEVEELTAITAPGRVDLDRALDQMDRVLDTEKEIKQAHLEMLVRIKNLLRPEQQRRLEELRAAAGEAERGG